MRRPLIFLFVVLVAVILVEAAYLYFRFFPLPQKTSSVSSDRSFTLTPTLAAKAAFQIVSQKEADVLGRTVVYRMSNTIATDDKNYAVGIFQGWEKVKESKDRYLLLQSIDDGKPTKYRVVFTPGRFSSWRVATKLAVEDLEKTKSGADLEAIDGVGRVGDLAERLDDMLIKGDIVAVRQTMPDGRAIVDENKIIITPWIAIRRYGGKLALGL